MVMPPQSPWLPPQPSMDPKWLFQRPALAQQAPTPQTRMFPTPPDAERFAIPTPDQARQKDLIMQAAMAFGPALMGMGAQGLRAAGQASASAELPFLYPNAPLEEVLAEVNAGKIIPRGSLQQIGLSGQDPFAPPGPAPGSGPTPQAPFGAGGASRDLGNLDPRLRNMPVFGQHPSEIGTVFDRGPNMGPNGTMINQNAARPFTQPPMGPPQVPLNEQPGFPQMSPSNVFRALTGGASGALGANAALHATHGSFDQAAQTSATHPISVRTDPTAIAQSLLGPDAPGADVHALLAQLASLR